MKLTFTKIIREKCYIFHLQQLKKERLSEVSPSDQKFIFSEKGWEFLKEKMNRINIKQKENQTQQQKF
jgi:hypothetical protein